MIQTLAASMKIFKPSTFSGFVCDLVTELEDGERMTVPLTAEVASTLGHALVEVACLSSSNVMSAGGPNVSSQGTLPE